VFRSTAAIVIRAGFLVVLVLFDVRGFDLVRAREWHATLLLDEDYRRGPMASMQRSPSAVTAQDGRSVLGSLYFAAAWDRHAPPGRECRRFGIVFRCPRVATRHLTLPILGYTMVLALLTRRVPTPMEDPR
jgi:hypothetical protein